jgi:hypothetical protein
MNRSSPSYLAKCATQLLMFLFFSTISACHHQQAEPPTDTRTGSLVGVNYTAHGIQWFQIGSAHGSSLGSYQGGGGYECCLTYPKTWSPTFKVTVKWERSDGLEPGGADFRIKGMEKIVTVEKYESGGNVYVLFLPDDVVKIFVSEVGVGNPDFPTRPGYPRDPRQNKATP